MKIIGAILSALFLLVSCASPKVMYDYDRHADFAHYKTFNFHPNMNLNTISELDGQRILHVVENQMKSKGFSLSETPDFYVDVAPSSRTRKKQAGSVGIGFGNWGRNFGVNIGTSVPITTQVQDSSLVLEIVDANSSQMVWQGVFEDTSSATSSPKEKENRINKSVNELLINFPPRQ